MINKIHHFCDFFKDYSDAYIIIGGAACYAWYDGMEPHFRPTHDLDVVLVLENLDSSFLNKFHEYITACGYRQEWVGNGDSRHPCMYRFSAPQQAEAPKQIELLSRKGDSLHLTRNQRSAPIKHEDAYAGLSSILLDDIYYQFLREHIDVRDGIPRPRIPALIVLKIKAYLNIKQARMLGKPHGSDNSRDNMKKHRNDVFFLLLGLMEDELPIPLPSPIRRDVQEFISELQQGGQEQDIMKSLKKRTKNDLEEYSLNILLNDLRSILTL